MLDVMVGSGLAFSGAKQSAVAKDRKLEISIIVTHSIGLLILVQRIK